MNRRGDSDAPKPVKKIMPPDETVRDFFDRGDAGELMPPTNSDDTDA